MWEISQIIGLGILTGMSVADIHFREVPEGILMLSTIGLLFHRFAFQDMNVYLLFGGAGIGILFLIISRITEERLGYGDSWAVLLLGVYLGIWKVLEILAFAFLLLALMCVLYFMTGNMKRKSTFPFYPFLTAGYIISVFPGVL